MRRNIIFSNLCIRKLEYRIPVLMLGKDVFFRHAKIGRGERNRINL